MVLRVAKGGEDRRVKTCFLALGAAERSVRLELRCSMGFNQFVDELNEEMPAGVRT